MEIFIVILCIVILEEIRKLKRNLTPKKVSQIKSVLEECKGQKCSIKAERFLTEYSYKSEVEIIDFDDTWIMLSYIYKNKKITKVIRIEYIEDISIKNSLKYL